MNSRQRRVRRRAARREARAWTALQLVEGVNRVVMGTPRTGPTAFSEVARQDDLKAEAVALFEAEVAKQDALEREAVLKLVGAMEARHPTRANEDLLLRRLEGQGFDGDRMVDLLWSLVLEGALRDVHPHEIGQQLGSDSGSVPLIYVTVGSNADIKLEGMEARYEGRSS